MPLSVKTECCLDIYCESYCVEPGHGIIRGFYDEGFKILFYCKKMVNERIVSVMICDLS